MGDGWLLQDAPRVPAGAASVARCHAQNNSLEEMHSQPWYVLLASIWVSSGLLQRIHRPGLHRGLLG